MLALDKRTFPIALLGAAAMLLSCSPAASGGPVGGSTPGSPPSEDGGLPLDGDVAPTPPRYAKTFIDGCQPHGCCGGIEGFCTQVPVECSSLIRARHTFEAEAERFFEIGPGSALLTSRKTISHVRLAEGGQPQVSQVVLRPRPKGISHLHHESGRVFLLEEGNVQKGKVTIRLWELACGANGSCTQKASQRVRPGTDLTKAGIEPLALRRQIEIIRLRHRLAQARSACARSSSGHCPGLPQDTIPEHVRVHLPAAKQGSQSSLDAPMGLSGEIAQAMSTAWDVATGVAPSKSKLPARLIEQGGRLGFVQQDGEPVYVLTDGQMESGFSDGVFFAEGLAQLSGGSILHVVNRSKSSTARRYSLLLRFSPDGLPVEHPIRLGLLASPGESGGSFLGGCTESFCMAGLIARDQEPLLKGFVVELPEIEYLDAPQQTPPWEGPCRIGTAHPE